MSDENPLLDFLLADLAWGKKPRCPADPRPGGVPAYIAPNCTDCNVPLVGTDLSQGMSPHEAWHDEFHCPRCGGNYLDVPPRASVEADSTIAADEAFAREIALAQEVCEDAEVDALTQPVPTVSLPFGKSD